MFSLWRVARQDRCAGRPESDSGTSAIDHRVGGPADAPFEIAEREFRLLLFDVWGFDRPVPWQQDKPKWWSADVSPS